MSIFSRIKDKIFGSAHAAEPTAGVTQHGNTPAQGAAPAPSTAPATPAVPSPAPGGSMPQPGGSGPVASNGTAPTGGTATPAPASPTGAAPASGQSVDVAAILEQKVAQSGQKLDWRHSIVDLMKLLDLDSSLTARKELADELHYTGDKNDSATMNVWLHKQVMTKLAENGGQVPADLRD